MTEQGTAENHYTLLGVKPTASPQEIRRAYRDLSKSYHPDTTKLSAAIAKEKFQILNEAYATLSSPEKRLAYDYSIGISRVAVIQAPAYLNRPASERTTYTSRNAYLDPTDRPLSAGEIFALFILGVTFVGCLILVFTIGWAQGEVVFNPTSTADALTETSESPAAAIEPELRSQPSGSSSLANPVDIKKAPKLPTSTAEKGSSHPKKDANQPHSLPSTGLSAKMI